MKITAKVEINIKVHDDDSNYCSRDCIYYVLNKYKDRVCCLSRIIFLYPDIELLKKDDKYLRCEYCKKLFNDEVIK